MQPRTVSTGDLNLITLDSNSNKVSQCINLLTSYGLENTVDLPTYVSTRTGNDTTCHDHLWHKIKIPHSSYVVSPKISDPYSIITIFNADVFE